MDFSQGDEWIRIENCDVLNAKVFNLVGAGIERHVLVKGCLFTKAQNHDGNDFVSMNFEDVRFENNVVVNDTATAAQGFTCGTSDKLFIRDNVFVYTPGNKSNAISLENAVPPSGYTYSNNNVIVENNVCVNGTISVGAGSLGNKYGARNVAVRGNRVVQGDIVFGNAVENVLVEGNVLDGGHIHIDHGSDTPKRNVAVRGNIIRGLGVELVLYYSSQPVEVKNLLIEGNVIDASDYTSGSPIYLWVDKRHAASDWYIANNLIINPNNLRIEITGNIARCVVKGNRGLGTLWTENFKTVNLSVPVGNGDAYGSPVAIYSPSGVITFPRVKITWDGTFASGETVTVKIEAVYADGSAAYVEKSATAAGSLWLTDDDIMQLISQWKEILYLNVYAKTNMSSTSVTVTVTAYGKG